MIDAYLAAVSAVAGSIIGALATLGTSWVSQRSQLRADRSIRSMNKRHQLYEDFIEEAAKLYADAMSHDLGDPSKLVHLYAIVGKLRLSAPSRVLAKADEIMERIIQLYGVPGKHFELSQVLPRHHDLDLIRAFSEVCREDLHHGARAAHGTGRAAVADGSLSGASRPLTSGES